MFAGGMAIGVPSFMPEASSDLSVTEGLLTVSTTTLQGAAILEIVVNDPDNSSTDDDVTALSVDVQGETHEMTQGVNGKWYLYVVDDSTATLADAMDGTTGAADATDAAGLEFGVQCVTGIGTGKSATTDLIVADSANYEVWVEIPLQLPSGNGATTTQATAAGTCLDLDGMEGTLDGSASTINRQLMSDAVLQGAPSLSNPDGDEANLGQRAHKLNASGYGSWPYIISDDLNDDVIVEHGSDSISVAYGNTDDETSISIANSNPADQAEIHLTITDPALNIDPTTADIWIFDLSDNDSDVDSVIFGNNGTNPQALDAVELGQLGCVSNCALSSDGEAQLASGTTGSTTDGTVSTVQMTETGANTGVFESFNTNGNAEFETKVGASADAITVFSYGGNSVDMIITYNDASITMGEAGQSWSPATAVTISVNDPDANRDPTTQETLSIGDETVVIPTIKVGSPLTLAASGDNKQLAKGAVDHVNGVTVGCGSGASCTGSAGGFYDLNIYNTTDNSERLRIVLNAEQGSHAAATNTWVNVTTSHSLADLVGLGGTAVLSYDVSGAADYCHQQESAYI